MSTCSCCVALHPAVSRSEAHGLALRPTVRTSPAPNPDHVVVLLPVWKGSNGGIPSLLDRKGRRVGRCWKGRANPAETNPKGMGSNQGQTRWIQPTKVGWPSTALLTWQEGLTSGLPTGPAGQWRTFPMLRKGMGTNEIFPASKRSENATRWMILCAHDP